MKRALILSFPYASSMGGGERYTEILVRGLKERGREFTLVSSAKALHEIFDRNGWPRHAVFGGFEPVTKLWILLFLLTAPLFILAHAGMLLWFKFARKTDVVICMSLTDKLLTTPMARTLKMRVIWMEHLIPGRSLIMNPYKPLYVRQSRDAEIVTVSNAARRSLAELGVPEARITVIPPGVAAPPRSTPEAKGYPGPIIGCVARLHPEKNVQMLLDAFDKVLHQVPDAKLEIYGDGPERADLEAVVKERRQTERVTFHGWVDSTEGFYRNFRVLAVPSKKESFGMAALEAEAHGVPVVAARVGGLTEAVAHQISGLLVPPNDADAMARALVRVLKDDELARKLGAQGRILAEKTYSQKKLIDAWASLLNDSPST